MCRLLCDDIILDQVAVPVELHPALAEVIAHQVVMHVPIVGAHISVIDLAREDPVANVSELDTSNLPVIALIGKDRRGNRARDTLHHNAFFISDIRADDPVTINRKRTLQAFDNVIAAFVHHRLSKYYLLSGIIRNSHVGIRKLPARHRDGICPAADADHIPSLRVPHSCGHFRHCINFMRLPNERIV